METLNSILRLHSILVPCKYKVKGYIPNLVYHFLMIIRFFNGRHTFNGRYTFNDR